MRGWLSYIAKASTVPQEIFAYEMLHQFLKTFRRTNVLDFDDAAAGEFVKLKSARLRVGTMDLKIASIALANKAILITRNLSTSKRSRDSMSRIGHELEINFRTLFKFPACRAE